MIKTLTVSALTVALAIAITACGGGDKKAETTPTADTKTDTESKPDTDTKPPPVASTPEPTCENAVAHGLAIMIKAGVVTQEKADTVKVEAVAKCTKENPPKEALACVLKASSPSEIAACDPKKK